MKTKTSMTAGHSTNLDRKALAALAVLKGNPRHMPVDGLCLEQLHRKGLIRPIRDGYVPTPLGERLLMEQNQRPHPSVGAPAYPDAGGPLHPVFSRN